MFVLPTGLKKVMKKLAATDAQEKLAVADAKLGQVIKKKFEIDCFNLNHKFPACHVAIGN